MTHDSIKNYISGAINYSGMHARTEVANAFYTDGKRPDITIQQLGLDVKTVHADVTITNSLAGRNNATCSNQSLPTLSKQGWAADKAAAAKNSKYRALCARNDSKFIPIVFESSGHMHPEFLKLLAHITDHASNTRKIPAHVLYRYHINTISVILHRCLADAMIRRSAQVLGKNLLPAQGYILSFDNIMLQDRAYVDRAVM